MNEFGVHLALGDPRAVLHWFDFLCPFCYIGQSRNDLLETHGLNIIHLPFRAHPDIPQGGIEIGSRSGPMYAMLHKEATAAGLPLHWPHRLPDTRTALAAAEWIREHNPGVSRQFNKELFAAHFVRGEDLGNPALVRRYAGGLHVDLDSLDAALVDGSGQAAVERSERMGRGYGVPGTPSWLVGGQLVVGLLSADEFERVAKVAAD
jgi:predicted DsbA family dithiol-disulfide isomerase